MDKLYVIKIGGQIVDDASALDAFLGKFCKVEGNKVLVHGGGKTASSICKKKKLPIQMINGRRITDKPTLEVLKKAYSKLNNKIVSKLLKRDCSSVGLSGSNQNILIAEKRKHQNIDFGYVGGLKKGDVGIKQLQMILSQDVVPVFSPLTHDKKGNVLNTNADSIASVLARALSAFYEVKLIYCFEKQGVLENANDEHSCLKQLNFTEYWSMVKQQRISEGMIPKLDNAFEALQEGVREVSIKHAQHLLENTGTYLKK